MRDTIAAIATATVLENTLAMLKITAPEVM